VAGEKDCYSIYVSILQEHKMTAEQIRAVCFGVLIAGNHVKTSSQLLSINQVMLKEQNNGGIFGNILCME
jgi:hypothetical protein